MFDVLIRCVLLLIIHTWKTIMNLMKKDFQRNNYLLLTIGGINVHNVVSVNSNKKHFYQTLTFVLFSPTSILKKESIEPHEYGCGLVLHIPSSSSNTQNLTHALM